MKTLYAVTLSVIAGFGLGILAGQLRAQTAPPAYVVTLFDSGLRSASDTDYPSLNPATFQPYGGHYITHFGKTVSFDGRPPNRSVIIAFDSMDKAQAWHASEAFKQSYDARKLSDVRAFAVEGIIPQDSLLPITYEVDRMAPLSLRRTFGVIAANKQADEIQPAA